MARRETRRATIRKRVNSGPKIEHFYMVFIFVPDSQTVFGEEGQIGTVWSTGGV